jgi:hypothetical protein
MVEKKTLKFGRISMTKDDVYELSVMVTVMKLMVVVMVMIVAVMRTIMMMLRDDGEGEGVMNSCTGDDDGDDV